MTTDPWRPGVALAARLNPADPTIYRQLVPTDVAQFIRLEQCERYLRLRLHERAHGLKAVRDYGVVPQTMPALLTRSGLTFERDVAAALARCCPTTRCDASADGARRPPDNERVLEQIAALRPGAVA